MKDLDKTIAEKQREKLEIEIAKLKDMKDKKGKSAIVFNLKEQVIGSKKAQQEPAVIKDPATREIVTDVKEIKKIWFLCHILGKSSNYQEQFEVPDWNSSWPQITGTLICHEEYNFPV